MRLPFQAGSWPAIRLVVFDVDGTLYDQGRLRRRMAFEMLADAARKRDARSIRAVMAYRRVREESARDLAPMDEWRAVDETVRRTGLERDFVAWSVHEWIFRRPLPWFGGCMYPGVADVFAGLKDSRRTVAVLSDYPPDAKMAAMGLAAHLVCGRGPEGHAKPHPSGLLDLMSRANAEPETTLVVGDRMDRDGAVAESVGTWFALRAASPRRGTTTFRDFLDPLFDPVSRRATLEGSLTKLG